MLQAPKSLPAGAHFAVAPVIGVSPIFDAFKYEATPITATKIGKASPSVFFISSSSNTSICGTLK